MTEIGTATIKINPVIDIEGLNASIRAAVAQALRKIADEMDTPAPTVGAPTAPFQVGDLVEYIPGLSTNIGVEGIQRVVKRVKAGGGLELAQPESPSRVFAGTNTAGVAPYRVRKVEAPSLWGYKVGDLVKYTERGVGQTEDVREVAGVVLTGTPRLSLSGPNGGPILGSAYAANQITRA